MLHQLGHESYCSTVNEKICLTCRQKRSLTKQKKSFRDTQKKIKRLREETQRSGRGICVLERVNEARQRCSLRQFGIGRAALMLPTLHQKINKNPL